MKKIIFLLASVLTVSLYAMEQQNTALAPWVRAANTIKVYSLNQHNEVSINASTTIGAVKNSLHSLEGIPETQQCLKAIWPKYGVVQDVWIGTESSDELSNEVNIKEMMNNYGHEKIALHLWLKLYVPANTKSN